MHASRRNYRHIRGLSATLLLLVMLSGCAIDLDGQDRKVLFPTMRATLPAAGGNGEWEFGVSQGNGSFSNNVASGEFVDFGGASISGLSTVTADIDLRVWHALLATAPSDRDHPSYRGGRFLVGFNWIEMDTTLRTTTPGGPYQWDDGAGSLVLGFEADIIDLPRDWGGGVRVLGAMGGHSNLITYWGEAEVRGHYRFTQNAEVFAGWRWWSYTYFHQDFASDLDTQLSGPTFGVKMRF